MFPLLLVSSSVQRHWRMLSTRHMLSRMQKYIRQLRMSMPTGLYTAERWAVMWRLEVQTKLCKRRSVYQKQMPLPSRILWNNLSIQYVFFKYNNKMYCNQNLFQTCFRVLKLVDRVAIVAEYMLYVAVLQQMTGYLFSYSENHTVLILKLF